MEGSSISRREILLGIATASLGTLINMAKEGTMTSDKLIKNGRLKQSVSYWCYEERFPLPDFCRSVANIGLTAIDLLVEEEWKMARQFGITCSIGYAGAGEIPTGLNEKANHHLIIKNLEQNIPRAARAGVPNIITFFGNRRRMPDAEAVANSIECLNRAKKVAEDYGVTICIELLNSKVDHKDYLGDHTSYGVEIVKAVGSPRVKLLYDIYHMQIMEGDIIDTINKYNQHIGHYHTGGVPGRHEINRSQELNYPAICKAILDTGFTCYLAHEFTLTYDPLTSLREAVAIFDV